MPDLPELAKYMMAAHQELMKLTAVVAGEKAEKVAESVVEKAAPLALVKTKALTPSTKRAPAAKRVTAARSKRGTMAARSKRRLNR